MIVITGGAGFIGSAIAWKMNSRGIEDILIVDRLGTGEKWRNLVSLKYLDFQEKSEFIEKLESGYYKDSKVRSFIWGLALQQSKRMRII